MSMLYHANTAARSLKTTTDHIRVYPKRWELMKWYLCWRKYPYPSDLVAALIAEGRAEGYSHYPCPLDGVHWHIGRGGGKADRSKILQRAKRTFRKAVRDEIRAEYEEKANVVRQEAGVSD